MCSIDAIREHEAVPTAIVLAEWSAELPSYGQTREWLLEQRRRTFTWDPDYVSDYDSEEDLSDTEADPESEKEDEDEIEQPPPPNKVPTGTTICPGCAKRFEPDQVVEYTSFGVRCPYCSQSIVL